MTTYDSTKETQKHIDHVGEFINILIKSLGTRVRFHDSSKLESPEKEVFDKFTPMLSSLTYGSDEYKKTTQQMQPAIKHHYTKNRHHPEHFENGISGMTLVDIVEMLCDWKAATLRHEDGDILKSIEINQKRFGFSDELKQILINTLHFISANEFCL